MALDCTTIIHFIIFHITVSLQYTNLNYMALQSIQYARLYSMALQCITKIHYTSLHGTSVYNYYTLHIKIWHCTVSLQYTTLHYMALHCITKLHYTSLYGTISLKLYLYVTITLKLYHKYGENFFFYTNKVSAKTI